MHLWSTMCCSYVLPQALHMKLNIHSIRQWEWEKTHWPDAYSISREAEWPLHSLNWCGAMCPLLKHLSLASVMNALFKGLQDQKGWVCSVTSAPSSWMQPCLCLPFILWTVSVFKLSTSSVLLLSFPNPDSLSQCRNWIPCLLAILWGSWAAEKWVLWDYFRSFVTFGLTKTDSVICLKFTRVVEQVAKGGS